MYRFKAIILQIDRIRDGYTRFLVLSQEYGKVSAWYHKKDISWIDLGDLTEIVISREGGINHVRHIESLTPSWIQDATYQGVVAFLETLKIITLVTIEWSDDRGIYRDIRDLITLWHRLSLKSDHYIIFQMRILHKIGYMDPNRFSHCPILKYIYQHIASTPLEKILQSQNIKKPQLEQIQETNWYTLHMLQQ